MDVGRAPAGFTVTVTTLGRSVVVRPEGELDHDTAQPLREALEAALRGPPGPVVIDCAGLTFCDSTGLNLLLRTRLAAEGDGRTLVLAGPSRMLARVLEITGAEAFFHIRPSVAEALAGPDG
ncbi:STAS domain-containing protein [Kitasatospora sp. NPDC048239]|uniref:STAS domain-containing protein n=1 Tax=Kitasatospora sp. NPDC048239 TaxID=3364046 RepID=UPI003715C7BB